MNTQLTTAASFVAVLFACSSGQRLEQVARQHFEKHNQHDLTGTLPFYTDDAGSEMPGWPPLHGKNALRDQFGFDSVLHSEMIVGGIRVHGDTVVIDSISERNDFFRLLGISEIHFCPAPA